MTSIDDLDFSTRVKKLLKKLLITKEDLCSYSSEDLLSFRGFGPVAVREIEQKLAEKNLSLKSEVSDIESLGLTTKLTKLLKVIVDPPTIKQLCKMYREYFLSSRGIGPVALRQIEQELTKKGLSLKSS